MNEESTQPKQRHIRRGIVLSAVFIVLEVLLFAGYYKWENRYLYNLSILLTPLAVSYIGSTCGGMRNTWSGRKWAVVAVLWIAGILGLTWVIELCFE